MDNLEPKKNGLLCSILAANLILWRDKKISAGILVGATAIAYLGSVRVRRLQSTSFNVPWPHHLFGHALPVVEGLDVY